MSARPDARPPEDDPTGDAVDHDRSEGVRSDGVGSPLEPDQPDEPDDGPPGADREPRAQLDAITEVEAEAEAERSMLDLTAHAHQESVGSGPPPNPRAGRQRFLVAYLRVALALVLLVGLIELVIPADRRDQAGAVMVGLLVVAPLGRVVWLMVRWQRRGDWRFALVGAVLLAVVATGFIAR